VLPGSAAVAISGQHPGRDRSGREQRGDLKHELRAAIQPEEDVVEQGDGGFERGGIAVDPVELVGVREKALPIRQPRGHESEAEGMTAEAARDAFGGQILLAVVGLAGRTQHRHRVLRRHCSDLDHGCAALQHVAATDH
jgi:hypothetical protein